MFQEVKFTRGSSVELHHILETTNFDDPIGNRFRYMVTKNLEVLKKEIDEINSAFPAPKTLPEYTTKRQGIYKKYSIKDEKAYAEMSEESKKSLDDEVTNLEEEYKDLLEEVKELEKEKNEFLTEEITVKLYKLKMDLMPTISKNNKYSGWDIWYILLKHVIIEPDD